jgi:hypothetical protein
MTTTVPGRDPRLPEERHPQVTEPYGGTPVDQRRQQEPGTTQRVDNPDDRRTMVPFTDDDNRQQRIEHRHHDQPWPYSNARAPSGNLCLLGVIAGRNSSTGAVVPRAGRPTANTSKPEATNVIPLKTNSGVEPKYCKANPPIDADSNMPHCNAIS